MTCHKQTTRLNCWQCCSNASSTIVATFMQPSAKASKRIQLPITTMREWISTPSVVVNERRVAENVKRMQQQANEHNVLLRPHIKTHKTIEIATLQLDAGACGITCSKPSEALRFFHAGIAKLKSILLAYPVVHAPKICKLLVAAQQFNMELLLTVDSVEGLHAADKAASSVDYPLKVLLHIDVGYHRVGLDPQDPNILKFARFVNEHSARLVFAGILCHAGHAYACQNTQQCRDVAEQERQTMLQVKQSLEKEGIQVPMVSVGSTLTELPRTNYDGITEIRPGNYVFLDRTPLRMGLCSARQVALGVLTTVVSINKYHIIVDAGSKVLSSDGVRALDASSFGQKCYGLAYYEQDYELLVKEPTSHRFTVLDPQARHCAVPAIPASSTSIVPPPAAPPSAAPERSTVCFEVVNLSEEHGWLRQVEGIPAPKIGDRLIIMPNHSCVVVNLTDTLYVQSTSAKHWKVLSRGCTQ